ncbi:hypothetical protein HGRIS_013420 [Hohenbuehelia grisea]
MSALIITIESYGGDDKKAEMELTSRIPEAARANLQLTTTWAMDLVRSLGNDLKFIYDWKCYVCEKPAGETFYILAAWTHLTPPRVHIFIHNLCAIDQGPCHLEVEATSAELKRESGHPGPPPAIKRPSPPPPNGMTHWPLTGACAKCWKEETATNGSLSRCGRCKMTRYCG